jgi:hypothetical protein
MLEITFSSEANATYDIEASNDLERGFISILEVVGTTTATTVKVPSDNLPERFYRVRLR